jgi:hypothetical protein
MSFKISRGYKVLAAATYIAIETQAGGWVIALPIIAFGLVASSIVIVPPGQSCVVQFFGTYVGTVRQPGFWCVWPLVIRRAVSIRVRNFETNRLKVNDADGNPIEIAALYRRPKAEDSIGIHKRSAVAYLTISSY